MIQELKLTAQQETRIREIALAIAKFHDDASLKIIAAKKAKKDADAAKDKAASEKAMVRLSEITADLGKQCKPLDAEAIAMLTPEQKRAWTAFLEFRAASSNLYLTSSELNLTEQQMAKIRGMCDETAGKILALQATGNYGKGPEMLQLDLWRQIRESLTPEQMQKMDKLRGPRALPLTTTKPKTP
ncbi:MAG: hypothetical protein ACE15C_19830 [Phycisphaerae bacterium]